MYKCTECGLEYENKPEYCDCGNNEFVLTAIDKKEEPVNSTKIEETVQKTLQYEYKSEETLPDKRTEFPFNAVSLSIFLICLIMSFFIVFLWNPKIGIENPPNKTAEITENSKTIPAIDKLWKENTIKQIEQRPVQPEPAKQPPAVIKPLAKKTTTVPLKKVSTLITKKQVKQTTLQPKPTVQPVQNTLSQAEIEAQKAIEKAKKETEAKQKAEAEAMQAAEMAKRAVLVKRELTNYKISLRNTIAKRIDFTKVIGDGICIISFKLDSNGRLIDREFAKQSENLTLNNAVYKAVMATPSFTPPPSGYKNETLRLNINFNNGNFSITLE